MFLINCNNIYNFNPAVQFNSIIILSSSILISVNDGWRVHRYYRLRIILHNVPVVFGQESVPLLTNGVDSTTRAPLLFVLLDPGVHQEVSHFPILEVRSIGAVYFRGAMLTRSMFLALLDSRVWLLLMVSWDIAVIIVLVEVNDLAAVPVWPFASCSLIIL